VRHRSGDIDNLAMIDVVKAIKRSVGIVNREYDIPYIAGYSKDGPHGFHRPPFAPLIPLAHEVGARRSLPADP
jgi:hypothetical protein